MEMTSAFQPSTLDAVMAMRIGVPRMLNAKNNSNNGNQLKSWSTAAVAFRLVAKPTVLDRSPFIHPSDRLRSQTGRLSRDPYVLAMGP